MNVSSVRVAWQWISSGPAPSCFNATTVTYHPEGGDESSLQLSDPAATEATLADLQCNTTYTITVCGGMVNVTIDDQETTVSGLTSNSTMYTFHVAAVHNQNIGPFSNLVQHYCRYADVNLTVYMVYTTDCEYKKLKSRYTTHMLNGRLR